jgi:hypothetical protein
MVLKLEMEQKPFSGQIDGFMANVSQILHLTNLTWISDIQGALTVGVMVDYLHLWDILADFLLQPNVEDRHIWRFSSDGQYSAKTAYKRFFVGFILSNHGKGFGRLGHHPNAASLFGW